MKFSRRNAKEVVAVFSKPKKTYLIVFEMANSGASYVWELLDVTGRRLVAEAAGDL
jgi:hypothetical protein